MADDLINILLQTDNITGITRFIQKIIFFCTNSDKGYTEKNYKYKFWSWLRIYKVQFHLVEAEIMLDHYEITLNLI
jgi:hypothetical protein